MQSRKKMKNIISLKKQTKFLLKTSAKLLNNMKGKIKTILKHKF